MSELFSSILIPGFFLLACILQLHYFHQPFMQLTDLEHIPLPGARRPRWAHRCGPATTAIASEGHGLWFQLTGVGGCRMSSLSLEPAQRRTSSGGGEEGWWDLDGRTQHSGETSASTFKCLRCWMCFLTQGLRDQGWNVSWVTC